MIGRGQLHKIRNVTDHLPEKMRPTVTSRMLRAYHADSALAAEAELTALAAEPPRLGRRWWCPPQGLHLPFPGLNGKRSWSSSVPASLIL